MDHGTGASAHDPGMRGGATAEQWAALIADVRDLLERVGRLEADRDAEGARR